MGHARSPLAPAYFILETSAALPETGFLADRGKHRNLGTSTCPALAESSAKRLLERDHFPEVLGLSGQLSCNDSSGSCVQHRRKARGDYFLARLHPASWERIVYENSVMGLDQLKHGMHCMFQADAKPGHSDPHVGLILLHLF